MRNVFSRILMAACLLPAWAIQVATASAGDVVERLPISAGQEWKISQSGVTLESSVNGDELTLQFEPAERPATNYIAASTSWEWAVPEKAKIHVDVRGETRKGCYFALRLTTSDGMNYEAVFGDRQTGFLLTPEGSAAEARLSSFKASDDSLLEPGAQVMKVTLILAPDASNTVSINGLSVQTDEH